VVANWWPSGGQKKPGEMIMAKKWITTEIKGLRYYVHPTRKRKKGIKWEYDVFYNYRRTLDGRRFEEKLGWLFEGMTLQKAIAKVHELNENAKLGKGPATLAEARKIAEQERRAAEEKAAEEALAKITFSDVWKQYYPQGEADRGDKAMIREEAIYRHHIEPIIGNRAMPEIAAIHLEKIKSTMGKAGMAPRSIQYALAIVRQVFNFARRNDLFHGDNPVAKIKMPKFDNRRTRFLTREEADQLLDALAEISTEAHAHALISLRTGMRAGEIWNLTWGDVDLDRGILTLRDTKNGRSRPAFVTGDAAAMLRARRPANPDPSALVFLGRGGVKIQQASETFNRAVAKLGLNSGITDTRQKVTFHTLRHTFASWLVENGTDLYAVKELLGHSDFKMTARYAHLGENTLQAAVKNLDATLGKGSPANGAKVLKLAQAG
jgi:integrase